MSIRKLDLLSQRSYPKLITHGDETVLQLNEGFNIVSRGQCLAAYASFNEDAPLVKSQSDMHNVLRLIRELDADDVFDSIYTSYLSRCWELSYLFELLATFEEPIEPENYDIIEEFLEEVCAYRVDCSVHDAMNSVKLIEDWPMGRRVGKDKAYFYLTVESRDIAKLCINERCIYLTYSLHGIAKTLFIGFKDYNELDTGISKFDWYTLCWHHLYQQLLAAVGIYFDEFQFKVMDGVSSFDEIKWDGKGMKPGCVSSGDALIAGINEILERYRYGTEV